MPAENIHFDSDGCTLAGTYVQAAAPVAAALLITGSGRTDRDSDARLPFHQTLRIGVTKAIAGALEAAQVSTLRYDKRGTGASGGDYLTTGFGQRLADARAALTWLAARTPGLPLLAIGHSEGSLHAAELAADNAVAGAALLSASAHTGEQTLTWQARMLASRMPPATRLILRIVGTDVIRAQHKNLARIQASSADVLRIQGTRVNARWLREYAAYDPAPALARITVPVLAITGAADLQVPPEDVETIGRLVRGPFEGHIPDDLSHLLRPDPARIGPRGYRRAVRQPVSPAVLALIAQWGTRYWADNNDHTAQRGLRTSTSSQQPRTARRSGMVAATRLHQRAYRAPGLADSELAQ